MPHCRRSRKNKGSISLLKSGKEWGRYALNAYRFVVSRKTCRVLLKGFLRTDEKNEDSRREDGYFSVRKSVRNFFIFLT